MLVQVCIYWSSELQISYHMMYALCLLDLIVAIVYKSFMLVGVFSLSECVALINV